MHWTITDDPGVGGEQFLVPADDLDEVRRAGLLFTFEEKLDV